MCLKALHGAQYAAVRVFCGLLGRLPWGLSRRFGRLIGHLCYLMDRRSRKERTVANLQQALPHLSKADAVCITRRVYCHLAESVVDLLQCSRRMQGSDGMEMFETVGFEKLAGTEGGVVFTTGHFGHWEVLGTAASLLGYPVWTVGRGFENPHLDGFVQRLRGVTGQRMLPKHGAAARMFRLLKEGQNVALLIDQDARRHGIFVDFFGRPASTPHLAARLCVRTGAPAAFVYAQRICGQNRFRVVCRDVVRARPGADPREETRRITQQLTHDLEQLVRRHPDQWLWLHRRWKTWPGKYGDSSLRQSSL